MFFPQRLQIRNMPRKQLEFREKIINVKIFRKIFRKKYKKHLHYPAIYGMLDSKSGREPK